MAGKGAGQTLETGTEKLDKQIVILKFTLLFTNVIIWMIGASIFALCLWLRFEPGLEEWIDKLELQIYYTGVYILIIGSIVVMIVAFVGCLAALRDDSGTLLVYSAIQGLSFILGALGSAFLLEFSTKDSHIEPRIRESMRRLIMNSHHQPSRDTLYMVQENVGCCGADGPNDYLDLRQPIPNQCRDSVTGNPFYHGCVDELIWYFEEKAIWVTVLAMSVCMIHVCNAVTSFILIKALKKEANHVSPYGR